MEVNIIGMDNNNKSLSHFEDDENENFDETIGIYNDSASANMKLISQLQEQIQKNIKDASVYDPLHRCFWITFVAYLK